MVCWVSGEHYTSIRQSVIRPGSSQGANNQMFMTFVATILSSYKAWRQAFSRRKNQKPSPVPKRDKVLE